jgi:anti-anti-sigma regulatory factor
MKQTKRKRANAVAPAAATTVAGAPSIAAEDSVMRNANHEPTSAPPRAADHSQPHTYALAASCTVRDSLALKSALLDLLMDQRPVTIDVRAVERIDTAALQVLCAFVRDRKAAGGTVLWIGCTESFCEAIRLLGLQRVLNVPDALLTGAAA